MAPPCTTEQRQRDYHYLVRILMSELVWYQGIDGIQWVFNFGNGDCPAVLEIPVNSVMGDTEGHDKLCARIVNCQGNSNRGQCRYCYCPLQCLGNPLEGGHFPMTFCGPIRALRNIGDADSVAKLDGMDYKPFHDGMVDIHFSDPERGLHACCPAELLHAFQLGIAKRAITVAFDIRHVSKKNTQVKKNRAKKARIQDTVEDPDFDASDEDEEVAPVENSVTMEGYYSSDDSIVYIPLGLPTMNLMHYAKSRALF